MGGKPGRMGVVSLQAENGEQRYVWVFDLGHLMRGTPTELDAGSQVVMVRHGEQTIGLLVDDLHSVPEFRPDDVIPTPLAAQGDEDMLVTEVIKGNGGSLLIQVINVGFLFAVLNDPDAPMEPLLPDPAALLDMKLAA
jgi:chemotaxis signal transduction protein